MKTIITILSTAAVLAVAISAAGFALDAAVILSICFSSSIAGTFVRDYSRVPRYDLNPAKAPAASPARRDSVRPPSRAGVEYASLIIFNTTAA